MNSRLEEAIERIKALPDHRQQEVAAMLFELLDVEQNPELHLSPEQIAEIEQCMSDDEPFATDEEVRAVSQRLTK
jgi:hypothetical protein